MDNFTNVTDGYRKEEVNELKGHIKKDDILKLFK